MFQLKLLPLECNAFMKCCQHKNFVLQSYNNHVYEISLSIKLMLVSDRHFLKTEKLS